MFSNDTTLCSDDRLALFGFGLFETLLITETGPLFVDMHWHRMNKGATFLGLELPNKEDWVKLVQNFIRETKAPSTFPYALRVTLSGGAPLANRPSQILFHIRSLPYTLAQYTLGIRLHVLSSPRNEQSPLASIKSTNYLENILAKQEALHNGAEEGLWLNTKGTICEGTMSNLFYIKDETLFTPSLASGCLPGTRRQLILDLAWSLKIPTYEGLYPFSNLLLSDEVFMTNALMGLMPVRRVNDFHLPIAPQGTLSSLMRRLESAYNALINTRSLP